MINTIYDSLDVFCPLMFTAGINKSLHFTAYNADGTLWNISGATIHWYLCRYGETNTKILDIEGVLDGANAFYVYLTPEDTLTLYGKYVQQVKITIGDGTWRLGQGIVIVSPAFGITIRSLVMMEG